MDKFYKARYKTINMIQKVKYTITSKRHLTLAVLNGNLKNMKWLKDNGCPCDTLTFSNASKNGNLENMKWLKENGCPWVRNCVDDTI